MMPLSARCYHENHVECTDGPPNCMCTCHIQEERREGPEGRRETVNHPSHYGGDTIYEVIKVIEAWDLNFSLGNAVKYIYRAGKKDGVDPLEDLRKAAWYLQREILIRSVSPSLTTDTSNTSSTGDQTKQS